VAEINLVDDRDDREIQFRRQMIIRHRLRLHALRRVNHQQRPLARAQAARHLIRLSPYIRAVCLFFMGNTRNGFP